MTPSKKIVTAGLLLALGIRAWAADTSVLELRGAGATFPAPIYAKWFANFTLRHPNVHFTYDAIGSESGIRNLLGGGIDFGASDNPRILHDLAAQSESSYLMFPSVIGAVVPIVNLPGVLKTVSLTPQALAGVYLGTIKKWNDPILREANPGVALPDLDIVVVRRGDGSGTTYAWTDYLSHVSPDWKTKIGTSLDPKWVVGRPASGNDGVAKLVKELGGSVGYVEYLFALKNHLSYARVQNRAGEFVMADLASIQAAASNAADLGEDFRGSIVDAPGKSSYPITTFTWLVVPIQSANDDKRNALVEFLHWMLGPGQQQAASLGYVSLPENLVSRETTAVQKIH